MKIDGTRIANAIRMLRNAEPDKSAMIVEGDSDSRFYKKLVDKNACELHHTVNTQNAKDEVIRALKLLESGRSPLAGVFAVVDADFMRIENVAMPSTNLFLTDGHDLECMLLKSKALEELLGQFASTKKLEDYIKAHGPIREALLGACKPLGLLRLYNHQQGLNLRFKNLEYKKFIDSKTLKVDTKELVRLIQARSMKPNLEKSLKALLKAPSSLDAWQICQGHDLTNVLAFALSITIGTNNRGSVDSEIVEKVLRVGYQPDWFKNTTLYKQMIQWEESQTDFRIFAT